MPRVIVLDSFALSCLGRVGSDPAALTERCRFWMLECMAAGNTVRVPAITYYETLRELERRGASGQIARLRLFCFADADRFLTLETAHLELAAQLWARSRNRGTPTSNPRNLDADVILAAQTLSRGLQPDEYVVATTNVSHLAQFVTAGRWTEIAPGS